MRHFSFSFFVLFMLSFQVVFGQNKPAPIPLKNMNGQWEIDLRPSPDAEPYLKDFIVQFTDEKHFSGSFYDTPFENGIVNSTWENIHFAFSTKDRNSVYVTVGYFDGEVVQGTTFCEKRDFVMPWQGKRKAVINN